MLQLLWILYIYIEVFVNEEATGVCFVSDVGSGSCENYTMLDITLLVDIEIVIDCSDI